ncbi:MAG TPA: alpha/beta-type small acid-soluble spore protein [Bacillota bacterium]|nr:alpha/beta-type small acid-soluble spore protein [Bacillota bacterium]HPZ89873.1 alpha/beta-type small acid-soluble spore protein [Bacillota bacterium]HQE01111.1 alpha/beta-type small acid-soluble spore protein [Bacillota bacterium]
MQYQPERNQGYETKRILVPEAEQAMENFKNEIASELGLSQRIQTVGFPNMTPRETGQIGGQMVRRMIEMVESSMSGGTNSR